MTLSRRLIWNTSLSLLFNLTVRAAGTLVFIAISHRGNIRDAGTFSLAIGYLAILATIFTGLDDLLIRESAGSPAQTPSLFITYGGIRLALSILLWLGMLCLFKGLSLYSTHHL